MHQKSSSSPVNNNNCNNLSISTEDNENVNTSLMETTTIDLKKANFKLISQLSSASNTFSIQSNTSSSAELCRICYMSGKKEKLLHPCKCSGTMGLIHKSCLEKWLASSNSNQCEICHHEFSVKRKTKPFYEWFGHPSSIRENKNLMSDLLCFFILTPLAVISAWLCILGALRYQEWESKWEAVGLVLLTCCLMFIYLMWCIISLKYHIGVFKEWQSKNHVVSLNISNSPGNHSRFNAIIMMNNSHNTSSINSNNNNNNNNNNNGSDINRSNEDYRSVTTIGLSQASPTVLSKTSINIENSNEINENKNMIKLKELKPLNHADNNNKLISQNSLKSILTSSLNKKRTRCLSITINNDNNSTNNSFNTCNQDEYETFVNNECEISNNISKTLSIGSKTKKFKKLSLSDNENIVYMKFNNDDEQIQQEECVEIKRVEINDDKKAYTHDGDNDDIMNTTNVSSDSTLPFVSV